MALVDEGREDLPPTGTAAVGAVIELAYRHLTGPDAESSMLRSSLRRPTSSSRPGSAAAPRWPRLSGSPERPSPSPRVEAADHLVEDNALRLTRLTESTLLYLADHPGARNVEIGAAIGVVHESQISRHLPSARGRQGGAPHPGWAVQRLGGSPRSGSVWWGSCARREAACRRAENGPT